MKSIIVSTGKKKSIALTEAGQFITVNSKKKHQEGLEVNHVSPNMKMLSVAAMVLIVMSLVSFLVAYNTPAYSITLDVNPSLEFYVNVFNKVINVNGMNEDGEYVLNQLDYKNNKLKEVLVQALADIEELGFIKDDYVVVIGVDGSEEKVLGIQAIVDTLKEDEIIVPGSSTAKVENEEDDDTEKSTSIIVGRITDEMRTASEELEVSPGKILLITKANEEGATLVYEDATYLSVQEIQKINKINSFITKKDENTEEVGNGKKEEAFEKIIEKETLKLEDSLHILLKEIENSEEDENNALLDRYITLTEQLNQVYSKVTTTDIDDNGTKSVGYEAAKAKVEARKAEKVKENDDTDTESDDGNGNEESSQSKNNNGKSGKN